MQRTQTGLKEIHSKTLGWFLQYCTRQEISMTNVKKPLHIYICYLKMNVTCLSTELYIFVYDSKRVLIYERIF